MKQPTAHDTVYASIDLELTGFDPTKDEILEIGFVFFRLADSGPVIIEEWSQVCRPAQEVHAKILGLTGISREELADAPKLSEIRDFVQEKLASATLVGHGVALDIRFLEAFGIKLSGRHIDTLDLVQFILPTHHSYNLENLMHTFEVPHREAHRALADCRATIIVLERLMQIFQSFPAELKSAAKQFAAKGGFSWLSLLDVAVEPVGFKQAVHEPFEAPGPFSLPHAGIVPLPLGYDARALVLAAVRNETRKLLLVVPHNAEVLAWWRAGFATAVFSPEDTFNPESFTAFTSRPGLTSEEIAFILKVLVWKYTNWQTQTVLDLNLSFSGGQYRAVITGGKLSAPGESQLLICSQSTFLRLKDGEINSDRLLVVQDFGLMERAITTGIGDRVSWTYIVHLLRSIYNPEAEVGATEHRETVISALAATDLFFGLVSLQLHKHFSSQIYVKAEDLEQQPYIYSQLQQAAVRYAEQLEVANAKLRHEGLERFVTMLKSFFDEQSGRVKWVELRINQCVLFNYPLEISDLFQHAVAPYQQRVYFSEAGNEQVENYFIKRLGLADMALTPIPLLGLERSVGYSFHTNLNTPLEIFDFLVSQTVPAVVLFHDPAQIKEFYKLYYSELKEKHAVFAQDYSGGSNKMLRNFGIRPSSILLVTPALLMRTSLPKLAAKTLIWTDFSLQTDAVNHPYEQALAKQWLGPPSFWTLRGLQALTLILKLCYSPKLESVHFAIPSPNSEEANNLVDSLEAIPFLKRAS